MSNLAENILIDSEETLPAFSFYDKIIVAFSGGKDSLASLLYLLELGVDKSKIELWHHLIDGSNAESFMDWPVTESYCKAVADHFEIPLYFSWREGGYLREMLRENQPTAPVYYETPDGVMSSGGNGKPNTRLKFSQLSADLRTRWCSAYLKIDVASSALRNQERFRNSTTLFITGERAEESSNRAKYKTFETHRTDARYGKLMRHIDHWRPVHGWSESKVWDYIREANINPHPAYELGFGRLSCMTCIFASKNQWQTIKTIAPLRFERIANYEEQFGVTIRRNESVRAAASAGSTYAEVITRPELARMALSESYDQSIVTRNWELPAGAFGESNGPT